MNKALLRYYSALNLGDDLFLQILADRYSNEMWALAPNRPKINADNMKLMRLSSWIRASIAASRIFGINHILSLLIMRKCDIYVYVGGSIFMEQDNLSNWRREARFYRLIKKPYYILGSNFGPYKTEEFRGIVRSIIAGAKDMCFRDRASYDAFRDLPSARLATDIVFTLDISKYKIADEKIVIFSLIDGYQKFESDTVSDYESKIVELTKKMVDDGYKVVYMSFCKKEGDEVANRRVMNKLPEDIKRKVTEHNYRGDLDAALSLIARSSIVL